MANRDVVKRRADLAEWYAREAIISETGGNLEQSREEIELACEYLSAIVGRRVTLDSASDVMAMVCGLRDGSIVAADEVSTT